MSDYKGTLNLPRTDFPMKGELGLLEPRMLAFWETHNVFSKMRQAREGAKPFVLHDGPPYANGHLHAGHALNKILKDIIVKYSHLSGRHVDFVPGWDCHGLPIERAVGRRLRGAGSLTREAFLQHCRAYALEYLDIQRAEFQRMGVLGRWTQPYRTLDAAYEAQEIREFACLVERGAVYRQKKPVYWCVNDKTALAEAEVEYAQHTSPSIYVAFPAKGALRKRWQALAENDVFFAIWTTTPWTLPANLAITVHPQFEYVFYKLDATRVCVVAKAMLVPFLAACAPAQLQAQGGTPSGEKFELAQPARILACTTGEALQGLEYAHVLHGKTCPILTGQHVTLEAGTGLVHTAPGHGQDDYEVGVARGLDIYNPVQDDGRFDGTVDAALRGLGVFEANPLVVDWLSRLGALLNPPGQTIQHSYPHCWRCHTPVILRATHQWFISMEAQGLRTRALQQVEEVVHWVPSWGRQRIRGMLQTRPDWCVSRQRSWGVPIPVAICKHCARPWLDAPFMRRVADKVEAQGSGIWHATPMEEFLPEGQRCATCGGEAFRHETDILDVWFDSACSFSAARVEGKGLPIPANLFLEGSDQHRGWFHASLLVSVGTRGVAPYQTCLTHGFVVDGNGNKMSKSQGNVVSPQAIIQEFGAEILRLWVASSDYRDDVRLSKPILIQLTESYRKVRNTLRYALANLSDFNPAVDAVPREKLLPLEVWILGRLDGLIQSVRAAYEGYEFHMAVKHIVDFCTNELSAQYFDIQKDTLYTLKAGALKRRCAQTALYWIAKDLLVMLAPLTSFTAEEAWSHLPGEKPVSVFLADFPALHAAPGMGKVAELEDIFALRAGLLPLLEEARRDKLIGKSSEAQVLLTASGRKKALLEGWKDELPELLMVSQVTLQEEASPRAQAVTAEVRGEVARALGNKCPRCWAYRPEVMTQTLCARCTGALS